MADKRSKNTELLFTLENKDIDAALDTLREAITAAKHDSKTVIRTVFSTEEILLQWQERFGSDASFVMKLKKRLRSVKITLECEGEEYKPVGEDELGALGGSILSRLGMKPEYSYDGKVNTARLNLKRPALNPLVSIFLALLIGVIVGFCGMYMPHDTRRFIVDNILVPLSGTYLGVLTMIAAPLCFCSILTGIYGVGNTATLGEVGKRLMGRFLLTTLIAAFIGAFAFYLIFNSVGSDLGSADNAIELFSFLISMLPTSVVRPFMEGNFTQITVLAVLIGVAMLILGKKASTVYTFASEMQSILAVVVGWICTFLPLTIVVIIIQNIWNDDFASFINVYKPVLLAMALSLLFMVALLLFTSIRLKVSLWTLVKKQLSTFIVAFTTASSLAAYNEAVGCCMQRFGIKDKLVNFGLPIGTLLCCPGSMLSFFACVFYASEMTGTAISPLNVLIAVLAGSFLMISAPPVAGGMITAYAVVMMMLGIPADSIVLITSLSMFVDFVGSAVNITSTECVLLLSASREGLVDRKKLLRI